MTDRGRGFALASTGARLAAGAVAAVVFVAVVVAGVVVPWPTFAREAVRVSVDPAPSDTVVACAGPLLALGRDAQRAGALSVAGDQSVVSGVADGGSPAESRRLASPDVPGSWGPEVVVAPPAGRQRTALAASGSASVSDDDLRGFAASACQPALMQSWLVAGATTTGSNDLVVLSNPGDVAATVQLTVFGATGPVAAPGGTGVVLPAGTQRVIPLAGLAIGEESPVVEVTSTGAPVQASLQSSIVRTLVPGGVDQSGAVAAASASQVITGIAVISAPGDAGASNPTSLLRVLAPTADATATVTVVAADGTATQAAQLTLSAGVPASVELGPLAVGAYSVRVDASGPVVAAAWQATGLGEGSDFAWYAASPALSGSAIAAVPSGPNPSLSVYNAGAAAETLTVAGAEVAVPAGRAVAVPVAAGSIVALVTAGADLHATVSFSGDGALAGFPVWPEDAAAGAIVVYP